MRLILFDIDGTLISSGGAGTLSLDLAFSEIFSVGGAFRDISMAGKTDTQIIREGLIRHNLPADNGVIPAVIESYLRNLQEEINHAGRKHLKPGVREALSALDGERGIFSLGLLTGNIEQGARIKLEPFGLNEYFPFGAFGSDDEDRNRLLPIAVSRCRSLYRREIDFRDCVVVGDTPRDVECARLHNAFSVAVATGPYSAASLAEAGADVVMEDLSDTDAFLRVLG